MMPDAPCPARRCWGRSGRGRAAESGRLASRAALIGKTSRRASTRRRVHGSIVRSPAEGSCFLHVVGAHRGRASARRRAERGATTVGRSSSSPSVGTSPSRNRDTSAHARQDAELHYSNLLPGATSASRRRGLALASARLSTPRLRRAACAAQRRAAGGLPRVPMPVTGPGSAKSGACDAGSSRGSEPVRVVSPCTYSGYVEPQLWLPGQLPSRPRRRRPTLSWSWSARSPS